MTKEVYKVAINGIFGRMGRQILVTALAEPVLKVVAGIDVKEDDDIWSIPVYHNFNDLPEIDLLIDFSSPDGMMKALECAVQNNAAFISGTTGITQEHHDALFQASEHIPIIWSPNMSPGINLLEKLVETATKILPEYDIEVVERHHKNKKDSPSGTALSIVDRITKTRENTNNTVVFGRGKGMTKRTRGEIGVHSVRGGGVLGDHSICFMSKDEEIEISHRAISRQVFSIGAIRAAMWILTKQNGLYNLFDTFNKE